MAETALDIVDHHLLEVGRNGGAAQGHRLLAVDEDRRAAARRSYNARLPSDEPQVDKIAAS
jgi:hypothetical protein